MTLKKPECCEGCFYNYEWKRCELGIDTPHTTDHVCDNVCQSKGECLFHNPNEVTV